MTLEEQKRKFSIWDKILNWASKDNFIPIVVGPNCCGHHIYHLIRDVDEVNISSAEFPMAQADLLIINGKINQKILPNILEAYKNLGGKKYVMTVGSCSKIDLFGSNYNDVINLEEHITVDIHVPGCPPLKEDFINGLKELKKR